MCICVCVCVCMYVCMCVCVCVSVSVCSQAYTEHGMLRQLYRHVPAVPRTLRVYHTVGGIMMHTSMPQYNAVPAIAFSPSHHYIGQNYRGEPFSHGALATSTLSMHVCSHADSCRCRNIYTQVCAHCKEVGHTVSRCPALGRADQVDVKP